MRRNVERELETLKGLTNEYDAFTQVLEACSTKMNKANELYGSKQEEISFWFNVLSMLSYQSGSRETIEQFLQKYPLSLDSSIIEDVEPVDPISLVEISEPMQASCGHIFEKASIERVAASANPVCPLCRADLNLESLRPITSLQTDMLSTQRDLEGLNISAAQMLQLFN